MAWQAMIDAALNEPAPSSASKTAWPAAQEAARQADPRPSEEIVREDRSEWER